MHSDRRMPKCRPFCASRPSIVTCLLSQSGLWRTSVCLLSPSVCLSVCHRWDFLDGCPLHCRLNSILCSQKMKPFRCSTLTAMLHNQSLSGTIELLIVLRITLLQTVVCRKSKANRTTNKEAAWNSARSTCRLFLSLRT